MPLAVRAPRRKEWRGRQIGDGLSRALVDGFNLVVCELLHVVVPLGMAQGGQEDVVTDVLCRMPLGVGADDVVRLRLVSREQSLVVADVASQHRLVVCHENREKSERGHMLAQDDETDGQGRGQEEADGTPEPGPEGNGDEQRRLREAQRLPVEKRLDHHIGEGLDHEEETDGEQGSRPAGEYRKAHGHGGQRAHQGSDVGHEAKGKGQETPQHDVGNADRIEPERDGQSIT